ncbi:hypothetical protein DJ94_942 [Bacillus pseudomycoides]|nr:hypothetical protein DJ94_942 [Bacillus pseudomycoides]
MKKEKNPLCHSWELYQIKREHPLLLFCAVEREKAQIENFW